MSVKNEVLNITISSHSPHPTSKKMESTNSTRALTRLRLTSGSNALPSSGNIDGILEQEDMEGLDTSDSSLYLVKEETFLQDGLSVQVTVTASVPTNSGYFTDAFLGGAALNPNASSQLRELCLSAQNARTNNEIPHQPVMDRWEFLLEESRTFRKDMRQKREDFVQLAKDVADLARWGCKQRWKRRRGEVRAWRRYRRRTALAKNWTAQEAEDDAKELARLALAQHVDRKKHRESLSC